MHLQTKLKWYRIALLIGTLLTFLIIIISFSRIIVPFVIAIVIAYILYPLIEWLHKLHIKSFSLPRWIAVLSIYTIFLTGIFILFKYFVPLVVVETRSMLTNVPSFFYKVKTEMIPNMEKILINKLSLPPNINEVSIQIEDQKIQKNIHPIKIITSKTGEYEVILPPDGLKLEKSENGYCLGCSENREDQSQFDIKRSIELTIDKLIDQSQKYVLSILKIGQQIIVYTVEFIFSFFLTIMLSAFILVDTERIINFFRLLFPQKLREEFDDVVERINRGLSGVIRGQIFICLINGTLSGIGFYIADLNYWPILTIIATVFSIVPIFGTIISSIPAVLLGINKSWSAGFFILIWIIGIHQLEANILNPKIMGSAARMHPVIVVFALMAGAYAGGLLGALLGVPIASIIQSIFLYFRSRAYRDIENFDT